MNVSKFKLEGEETFSAMDGSSREAGLSIQSYEATFSFPNNTLLKNLNESKLW
jgi:hypothetical protein